MFYRTNLIQSLSFVALSSIVGILDSTMFFEVDQSQSKGGLYPCHRDGDGDGGCKARLLDLPVINSRI